MWHASFSVRERCQAVQRSRTSPQLWLSNDLWKPGQELAEELDLHSLGTLRRAKHHAR